MDDNSLTYELTEGVAVITFNRPELLNALGHPHAKKFLELLDRAVDDGARALITTGVGRFYSSGGDLTTNLDLSDIGEPMERLWNPLSEKLMNLPIPVITAMNGPAVGVSVSLALLSDIVIAEPQGYFLLSFANLGLIPDGGATWLLAKSIGRQRAMNMIMLAERLPVQQAYEWGLVSSVVETGESLSVAREIARKLAKGPTLAYNLIRQSMLAALENGFSESLKIERVLQKQAGASHDCAEALAAFAEKRKPLFVGS
ncbi:enoyl-CoA hydratase-related protein [Sphingopyxis granuli]|uniref:enoyl-CoA hydratase-related protein n=1 Tax=Sphingopyxis granuli TaxID=267128 RepID=UPI001F5369FC|nr:enoyl-CoA hydratase-related protein [Sphingopyxis granuli]UNK81057.1 enoyl-CoA hydratase-related protein [Sphingopyxis granuli]